MTCSAPGSMSNLRNVKNRRKNITFLRSGVWNALRWVPFKYQKSQKSENHTTFLKSGVWNALRWVPFKSQKSQTSWKKHYVFEFWCVECSSLGPLQISEISEIAEQKHYILEIWCLECSSLGPLQISEISEISDKQTLHF